MATVYTPVTPNAAIPKSQVINRDIAASAAMPKNAIVDSGSGWYDQITWPPRRRFVVGARGEGGGGSGGNALASNHLVFNSFGDTLV